MFFVRGWAENSPLPRARLQGQNERLRSELLLAREELRLKDARMSRLSPARRPHYSSAERLEILLLAAARGWSIAETARRFLVTSATIADWKKRCDEEGADALVQVREPVNKFPDFVTALVQQCQALVPVAGRRKIADHLARAGLHLSASTIKRRLEARPVAPAPIPTVTPQGDDDTASTKSMPRTVVARHPHHVWGADLTLMSLGGGFAVPWWPFCCLPCWPFCWWLLLVVDHFSRAVVHVAVFAKQPSEAEVVAALEQAVQATGPPRHFVTDQGAQFQGAFRDFSARHGIRQRYGAIGKYGSIAMIERVNRTLKHEGLRHWLLPFRKPAMLRELELWRRWYNELRPHASHFGATPTEVLQARLPACGEARFEARERGGGRALLRARPGVRLELDVSYLEGRPHLPVVSLKQAA